MEALIDAHARELHLPSIRDRFRLLAQEAMRDQQTPLAYLAALLEAEVTERAERRERRRLIDERFPLTKRLEDFRFEENPKIPQATVAALAQGSWIDDREAVILLGTSGTGNTHLRSPSGYSPANKDAAFASPPSRRWRPSCKQPSPGAGSAVSSPATHAPSSSSKSSPSATSAPA
jgi:IstB-like ATP binding protein